LGQWTVAAFKVGRARPANLFFGGRNLPHWKHMTYAPEESPPGPNLK
jgi:hypothetical protein